MGQEIELKFQIPAARRAALERAVATRSARVQALAASYVDTAGEHLAAARIALRLRLEDGQCVQTLKAEDAIAMVRHEHNVTLAPRTAGADVATGAADPGQPPPIDPARHAGTPAHALLLRALAQAAKAPGGAGLHTRYRTQVQRTTRCVRHQGAVIELALDQGLLLAGPRQLPLAELELELVRGPASALLDLAARWASRHGLVLDVRSKSERGQGLARLVDAADASPEPTSPPANARALVLPSQGTLAQAGALMLANTLQQALANASQLANGPGTAEHVHQLRVGLRRLRTVLRVFPHLFPGLVPEALADLQLRLTALFSRLGAQRDQDVRQQEVWPRLRAAGAPDLPEPSLPPGAPPAASGPAEAAAHSVEALLRSTGVQTLWLQLLALAVPDAADTPPAEQALAPLVKPALKRLLRQVRADAAGFATLNDEARHRLRRRIKRLRYATALCASLWPKRAVGPFLKALQQAQTPLGALNDNLLALAHYRALAAQVPEAWFAVGWLTAQHGLLLADGLAPMAALAQLRGCWRAGPGQPAQASGLTKPKHRDERGDGGPDKGSDKGSDKRPDKRSDKRPDKRVAQLRGHRRSTIRAKP